MSAQTNRMSDPTGWKSRFALGPLLAMGFALSACSQSECPPVNCDPLDLDSAAMQVEITKMLKTTDTLDRHRRMVQLIDAIDEDNLPGAVAAYNENLARANPHEAGDDRPPRRGRRHSLLEISSYPERGRSRSRLLVGAFGRRG